jgi:branched-chain amino acid transport system substrate-binding protein
MERQPLPIGVLLSTSGSFGDLATSGRQLLDAVTLAVEEINAAGGVLGRPLRLLHEDDRSDKDHARRAAEALRRAGIPVVLGPINSSFVLETARVLCPAQIVQISGSASAPGLTREGGGYLFRTCPSDAFQGKLLARRAAERFTRAAVLHASSPYGAGLADAFETSFRQAGGAISFRATYTDGAASHRDLLATMYACEPEAVLLVGLPPESAQMMRESAAAGSRRQVHWYFTDSLARTDFIDRVGGAAFQEPHEGAWPTIASGPGYRDFAAAYEARYGKMADDGFVAHFYDAAYLAALAIEKAGRPEGPEIRDALFALSGPGERVTARDYPRARRIIGNGEAVNYDGASGPVDFDADGEVAGTYDLWEIRDGVLTITHRDLSA